MEGMVLQKGGEVGRCSDGVRIQWDRRGILIYDRSCRVRTCNVKRCGVVGSLHGALVICKIIG